MAKKATPEELEKLKELFANFQKSVNANEKMGYKTHIQQILSDIGSSTFNLALITSHNVAETTEIIKNAIDYYS